ncbi:MAG: exodeoxyribonuclease VII small subunit [Oscillospiraceae bacterium]|jgi:exodeoxyribonuclease VII small subunit
MEEKQKSFEASIQRLNEIVTLLEKGDAPLEQALTLFEEGTALVKQCSGMLDQAEQTVVRLKKGADGMPEELPFEEE